MKHVAKLPRLAALSAAVMSITGIAAAQTQGPSSSQPSYVLPSAPGVSVMSIMTVGDSVNMKPDGVTPYRMIGIPDGMGAYDNGDGTFTVLMNHEIAVSINGTGVATGGGALRAHGNAGGFVSLWTIQKSDLTVLKVEDFAPNATSVYLSNNDPATGAVHTGFLAGDTTPMGRLCSADLAEPGAYGWTDPATGIFYGTTARIFQSGEEMTGVATSVSSGRLGPEGRVDYGRQFAFVATDDPNVPGNEARTVYEMPHHGLFAWENNLASPFPQRKTIVAGTDDTSPAGQVYFWVGEKQTTGNVVERAGLVRTTANDNLYVVKIAGLTPDATGATNEVAATPLSGRFSLENEGDISGLTSGGLENLGDSKGGTQFLRPEDGHFDPNHPNDFYFVTTNNVGAGFSSRLYRLRFDDITNPTAGGTITAVIDGGGVGTNSGFGTGEMYDNIVVDSHGRVLLEEDVGNNALLGKVWIHDLATGGTLEVARHDSAKFITGQPGFLTQDEENSGVIDISDILGPGKYLMTDQIHANPGDTELVERGQLQLMTIGVTAGIGFDAKTNRPAFVALGTDDAQTIVLTDSTATVDGVLLNSGVVSGVATTKVLANGYAGNDKITAGGITVPAALFGGDDRDLLTGGFGDDLIVGGEGHDTVKGGGGSDTLVQ